MGSSTDSPEQGARRRWRPFQPAPPGSATSRLDSGPALSSEVDTTEAETETEAEVEPETEAEPEPEAEPEAEPEPEPEPRRSRWDDRDGERSLGWGGARREPTGAGRPL